MTKPSILRLPVNADDDCIREGLAKDGAVILVGMLTQAEVDKINAELDTVMGPIEPGNFAAGENSFVNVFYGLKTKRIQHCLKHSATYRTAFLSNPRLAELIALALSSEIGSHALFASQAIEIYPGEEAQTLHRDGSAIQERLGINHRDGVEIVANTLLALTDITEEMGATRAIPGSHRWPDFNETADPDATVPVLLDAGDFLLLSGKLLHGGGANLTKNRTRRLISTSFTPGFIVSEEAWPFVLGRADVAHYDQALQKMLYFRSVSYRGEDPGFLWRADTRPLEDFLGL